MKINDEKSLSLIASNKSIIFDAGQTFVSEFFDNLLNKFDKVQTESFITKIFTKNNTKNIKGLYLYGGVGRGKSMMMDLFFHQVQINLVLPLVHKLFGRSSLQNLMKQRNLLILLDSLSHQFPLSFFQPQNSF